MTLYSSVAFSGNKGIPPHTLNVIMRKEINYNSITYNSPFSHFLFGGFVI